MRVSFLFSSPRPPERPGRAVQADQLTSHAEDGPRQRLREEQNGQPLCPVGPIWTRPYSEQ